MAKKRARSDATQFQPRFARTALMTALLGAGFAMPAHAFIIDTGNEDVAVRLDTSLRYNVGVRVEKSNPDFANQASTDATEGFADRGDLVTNRLDLLSEMDVVYKGKYGFRVSGAAWNDFAVRDRSKDGALVSSLGYPTEYSNGEYNSYVKRYVRGPSAEFLDAFVFGQFDLGVPVNVKLGNHVVYWGEGLFNLFHSISYSQAPLNLQKAASSPGIEAKEVFMPIRQLSAQAQLTDDFSVAAQVMLDWKPARLPPGGTYFAAADGTRADVVAAAPGFAFPVGADIEPNRKTGQFGVNARWSPDWLQGTVGVYYRRFNEVMPWAMLSISGAGVPQNLHLGFAKDTEMYALSLAKNVGPVNLGLDLSYRKNTALNSAVNPAGLAALGFQGLEGARGNTYHLVANSIFLLPNTVLSEGGSLQAEFVYSHLEKVTRNANLFAGEGYVCAGEATVYGCATRNYMGIQVGGNLDYPQVLPGTNLSVPFSFSYGLKGNAANLAGGTENAMNWSLGLQANYHNAHEFTLKYNDSHIDYRATQNPNGTTTVVQNGSTAVGNNHGWVSFTYKTSF